MPKEESIGCFWEKEGQNGTYMSGVVEIDGVKHSVVVFKNSYKKEDKQPDWRIYPKKERGADDENVF